LNAPLRQPALRELPLADMRRAEDLCRILATCMAGEALATLSAATALVISRLNPRQDQDRLLILVQYRTADELRVQQDERGWPRRG